MVTTNWEAPSSSSRCCQEGGNASDNFFMVPTTPTTPRNNQRPIAPILLSTLYSRGGQCGHPPPNVGNHTKKPDHVCGQDVVGTWS